MILLLPSNILILIIIICEKPEFVQDSNWMYWTCDQYMNKWLSIHTHTHTHTQAKYNYLITCVNLNKNKAKNQVNLCVTTTLVGLFQNQYHYYHGHHWWWSWSTYYIKMIYTFSIINNCYHSTFFCCSFFD